MSEGTGAGPRTSLYEHVLRLHEQHPDGPLPRGGEPFPNDPPRRGRRPARTDRRLAGADAAAVLDRYLAGDAHPSALVGAFRELSVPIHPNDHLAAAALRTDRERVRRTGRWLVRHGPAEADVLVGLALLASDWDEDDIPLIRTIGLSALTFGPLAAAALQRRRGGADALLWLGERVTGWGRVSVVEALCRVGGERARPWLLRRACDGDFLNAYFAGEVATAAHLHHAITTGSDDALVDHTGRLLVVLGCASGMGTTLGGYPPARAVVEAHAGHLARQAPTADRFATAVSIASDLAGPKAVAGATREQRDDLVERYRAVLDRDAWCAVVRPLPADPGDRYAWLPRAGAALGLRAFGA
ncbi:hypothetical protein [Saccharothrix syringae]|uniref:Uncharacterized protein n=1 Tax=Saccharothrix syringae TaxID=103733 RepID=A0A5Q0GTB9_SACSY|nr:hypothetical protein [Saccharothrix syringae]QFZ17297.1 hypothetical protein EKG83_07270 [Saccharothrix syringae]